LPRDPEPYYDHAEFVVPQDVDVAVSTRPPRDVA
jgi:hypothetical protein